VFLSFNVSAVHRPDPNRAGSSPASGPLLPAIVDAFQHEGRLDHLDLMVERPSGGRDAGRGPTTGLGSRESATAVRTAGRSKWEVAPLVIRGRTRRRQRSCIGKRAQTGRRGPRSAFAPASRRLPDRLPDPVEVGGTGRYRTGQRPARIPCGTRRNGTRRHGPGRGTSTHNPKVAGSNPAPATIDTEISGEAGP